MPDIIFADLSDLYFDIFFSCLAERDRIPFLYFQKFRCLLCKDYPFRLQIILCIRSAITKYYHFLKVLQIFRNIQIYFLFFVPMFYLHLTKISHRSLIYLIIPVQLLFHIILLLLTGAGI